MNWQPSSIPIERNTRSRKLITDINGKTSVINNRTIAVPVASN